MKEILRAAIAIAREAGAIVRDAHLRGGGTVGHKGMLIDLVTDTDRRSEALILERVHGLFPDHAVIAEESGTVRADGPWRWIIDPLDGTVNFAHGFPHFAVLIAVQERCGRGYETRVGVTYDPVRDELFAAGAGAGATLNERPIRVSGAERLIDAICATGFVYDRLFRRDDNHAEFCRMNLLTRGVRRAGSAGLDLAYVACGRVDVCWEYGLKPWDLASGALILTEAGGRITNLGRTDLDIFCGDFLASNGRLHDVSAQALISAQAHAIGSREDLERFLPREILAEMERKDSGTPRADG